MRQIIEHHLLERFIADAVSATRGWFVGLLAVEVANGTTKREFNLNTIDVTVDWVDGSAMIHDALGSEDSLQIELAAMTRVLNVREGFSTRITDRIRDDFGAHHVKATALLAQIHEYDIERLAAASLIWSRGDMDELKLAVTQSYIDWRDLLMWTGLANPTWKQDLDHMWSTDTE